MTDDMSRENAIMGSDPRNYDLSPPAAQAATELIQKFLLDPNTPITTEEFLKVQLKYQLQPNEAYKLLLQQIQF